MRKETYRISKKAIQDLEDIWLYTFETWSQQQADRYYSLLINEMKYIANNFESGKSMSHIKLDYRAAKVKSQLSFIKKAKMVLLKL